MKAVGYKVAAIDAADALIDFRPRNLRRRVAISLVAVKAISATRSITRCASAPPAEG